MQYEVLSDFFAATLPNSRLMCLDIGEAKIGIAFSDRSRVVATPHNVLSRQNKRKDMGILRRMCQEHGIGGIVIGLPKQLDGNEGENCILVRNFGSVLAEKTSLPVFYQDERFTTSAVNKELAALGVSRKKRHAIDDALAACYLLQGILDHL